MVISANFKLFSINDCFLLEYQCQQIYLNLLPITVLLASSATRFAKMLTLGIEAKNNAFGQNWKEQDPQERELQQLK